MKLVKRRVMPFQAIKVTWTSESEVHILKAKVSAHAHVLSAMLRNLIFHFQNRCL